MRLRIFATVAIDQLFEFFRTLMAINSCTSPRSHICTSSVPSPTTMGADLASAFFFWRYVAIYIPQEGSLSPSTLWVHTNSVDRQWRGEALVFPMVDEGLCFVETTRLVEMRTTKEQMHMCVANHASWSTQNCPDPVSAVFELLMKSNLNELNEHSSLLRNANGGTEVISRSGTMDQEWMCSQSTCVAKTSVIESVNQFSSDALRAHCRNATETVCCSRAD